MNKNKSQPKAKRANAWDGIPDSELTWQQKIAKKTNGIITIPNGVTMAGTALSGYGLYEMANGRPVIGTIAFGAGRIADLLDGNLARRFKVWGGIGESIDAGMDKVVILGALAVMTYTETMPVEASVPLLATQAAILGIGAVAQKREIELHSSKAGKYTMFAGVSSVGSYMAAEAVDAISASSASDVVSTGLEIGGGIAAVASVGLGVKTAIDYGRQTFSQQS